MSAKQTKKRTAKNSKGAKRKAVKRKAARAKKARKNAATAAKCGLCGATTNLTKTDCCGQWICDDEDQYVMFSYAHNSCSRNHRRYTLCGAHFVEEHPGHWKDCEKCREDIETEMYVYYGTNEYNFEVLENPPEYEPTRCDKCGVVIALGDGGYSYGAEGYLCGKCTLKKHPRLAEL